MSPELTNLVPHSKAKLFRQDYFIRLIVVMLVLVALLFFVQCILLLPSYIYENQSAVADTRELARLSASLATMQDQEVQKRLNALQAEAAHLQSLATTPTASAAVKAILLVPRPGIILTGFTFTQAGAAPSTMQVSGVASTREVLRSYDAALAALPFVKTADLPISDYAKASNIPFTVTLTGSLTP